jgi:hypothetical protein
MTETAAADGLASGRDRPRVCAGGGDPSTHQAWRPAWWS